MPDPAVLHLTWTLHGADAEYFLDGRSLGVNTQGFEALLEEIARREDIEKLIVENPPGNAAGGLSEEETLPFYPSYEELMSLLRARNITLEMAPVFGAGGRGPG